MKDVFKLYMKSTEEMRAMLAARTPEEAAFDREILKGLHKGWSVKKSVKRAGEKYPGEAIVWSVNTRADIKEHYERLWEHEEFMAKAGAFGFTEDMRRDEMDVPVGGGEAEASASEALPGASYRALDRIMERDMERNPNLVRELAAKGKGTISFGRKMTDGQLLDKLRSLGVEMDRMRLDELRKGALSAAELSEQLTRKHDLKFKGFDADWLWVSLAVLWERWFPETPSLEMIDDAMQAGYVEADKREYDKAVELWLVVWKDIRAIMEAQGIKFLDDFDGKFRGTQFVGNWVSDVETELLNAGSRDPEFARKRIAFCEEVIELTSEGDQITIENMRRAIGDAYAQMGDMRKADELFQEWLKADPKWGWGWIGWSDCYTFWDRENDDSAKAEELLKQGLSVSGVRDRYYILDRLLRVYKDIGRQDAAERIQEELSTIDDELEEGETQESTEVTAQDNVLSVKTKVRFGGEGMPLDAWGRSQATSRQDPRKVGRNEPCPCGSGKKYKKCCGG